MVVSDTYHLSLFTGDICIRLKVATDCITGQTSPTVMVHRFCYSCWHTDYIFGCIFGCSCVADARWTRLFQ